MAMWVIAATIQYVILHGVGANKLLFLANQVGSVETVENVFQAYRIWRLCILRVLVPIAQTSGRKIQVYT